MLLQLLISFSILFHSSLSVSWNGSWLINKADQGLCCSPYADTVIHFRPNPNNASEVIVVGAFDAGSIEPCGFLEWQAGIELVWPFSINDFSFVPQTYRNATGFEFTIMGKQHEDGTLEGIIITDQSLYGGSKHCVMSLGPQTNGWEGQWKVVQGCGNEEFCCCPNVGEILVFEQSSKNASELQVMSKFPNNSVCQTLGWKNSATVPWSGSDFDPDPADHMYVVDKYGVSYNVTLYDDQVLDFTAFIFMNQFAAGGAAQCNLTLFQQTIHKSKE